jgi:hypothetical protein
MAAGTFLPQCANAAKANKAYTEMEVEMIVRNTAIKLKLTNHRTGQLYDSHSDVTTLVGNFLNRCAKKGVCLLWRSGRKLGMQRALRCCWETLARYGKEVASPALITFQKKHDIKLTLADVGNFDEAQVHTNDPAVSTRP